jgi:hypothetical protein
MTPKMGYLKKMYQQRSKPQGRSQVYGEIPPVYLRETYQRVCAYGGRRVGHLRTFGRIEDVHSPWCLLQK